jgi:YegS/Rv2252/BmrU family lipid kinase
MTKPIGFIINPAAGVGRCPARWAALRAQFLPDGIRSKCLFTARPGDAVRFAQALATECEIVVAVGGDGTLFEVATGLLLAGTPNPTLGLVPLGTGNDTARLCGVGNVAQARLALRGARPKNVDAIRISCQAQGRSVTHYGLLYGAVGLIGEALKHTTPRVKRIFGRRLAYPVGALRAILSYRSNRMRVTCDGQFWENRFLLACASNAELSGGGMRLAPGATMDDGLLDVNLCEAVGRLTTISLLWQVSRGRRVNHPRLRYFTARSVALDADSPLEVQADGELIGYTPVQINVVPHALRVLVP